MEKVSFDKALFHKELMKAVKWITLDEKSLLEVWCLTKFGHKYKDEITQVFKITYDSVTEF
ncbi:MAG TPA: hypothetical protein VNZ49_15130 [Bacteroidia bacterium]|nr:hypothetical protein [Bacteroidia bacterium]